jgi:hypothetical protein
MRAWFTALKYDIESYEVEEILTLNSLLIFQQDVDMTHLDTRCEGEAKLADVAALRKAVDEQKTKEGWLVAARRISSATCDAVKRKITRM